MNIKCINGCVSRTYIFPVLRLYPLRAVTAILANSTSKHEDRRIRGQTCDGHG